MVAYNTIIPFTLAGIGGMAYGWWFYRALSHDNTSPSSANLGPLIGKFYFSYSPMLFIVAIGALFYSVTGTGLFLTFFLHNIAMIISALFGANVVSKIFFPKKSPLPIFFSIGILGATLIFSTIYYSPSPFITLSGALEWNLPFMLSLNVFYMLLINLGLMFYIFARLFLITKNPSVRRIAIIHNLLILVGIYVIFMRFVTPYLLNGALTAQFADLGMLFVGIIFILIFAIIPVVKYLFLK